MAFLRVSGYVSPGMAETRCADFAPIIDDCTKRFSKLDMAFAVEAQELLGVTLESRVG